MERKRQREIALAAIAIALIAVAAFRIRTAVSGNPANRASQGAAANRHDQSNQKGQVTAVDLQALEAERPEPVEGTRNPFRFRPKPAPPPPPSPEGPLVPSPGAMVGPLEPPQLPRIPLKFIGWVQGEKTGRVAVLTDGRGVIYGRENQIILGRYRILKIGVESIDLAYLDGRGRQTIPKTGQ